MGSNQKPKIDGVSERILASLKEEREAALQLETALKDKRREIARLEFFLGGSDLLANEEMQRLSGLKPKRQYTKREENGNKKKPHHATNNRQMHGDWTPEEDQQLVAYVKEHGKVPASEVSRAMTTKLKGRSEGGIRQRLYRLADNGTLKGTMMRKGSVPRLNVEAA